VKIFAQTMFFTYDRSSAEMGRSYDQASGSVVCITAETLIIGVSVVVAANTAVAAAVRRPGWPTDGGFTVCGRMMHGTRV